METLHRFGEIRSIHVGDETEGHVALGVMLKRLIGNHWTEVGAADSDIYDIANAFAGVAFPFATAHTLGEVGHPVEHCMNFGHDVLSVNNDRFILRSPESHVQNRPLLGDVDFLAAEHGINSLSQAGLLGELEKEIKSFIGDAVLGIIEVQANSLDYHALSTFGIVRKKLPQMQL